MSDWIKNLGLFVLSLLAVLLISEAVLRLLPVSEGLGTQPVNDQSPILHFEPSRTHTWSTYGDMAMANRVRVNNEGFVNDQDYASDAPGPLVAVVGDSYVEAMMVPYAQTLQGRLAEALRGRARVYSFAASGAPLSQYLAYAAYARDRFQPQRGVVVVVGNDFDESLLDYKHAPGLHSFRRRPDGQVELARTDYAPGALRNALCHSRLALYLVNNLGIGSLPVRLRGLFAPKEAYVGQTSARLDEKRLNDSLFAIDSFLAMLPRAFGLPPEDILLVLDAPRPDLYDYDPQAREAAQASYFGRMRTALKERARVAGVRVVDMQEHFLRDYGQNGQRFEFPRDAHWNGRGHQLAAEAVLASGVLEGLR